jgi:hypothetical protein
MFDRGTDCPTAFAIRDAPDRDAVAFLAILVCCIDQDSYAPATHTPYD